VSGREKGYSAGNQLLGFKKKGGSLRSGLKPSGQKGGRVSVTFQGGAVRKKCAMMEGVRKEDIKQQQQLILRKRERRIP